MLNLKKLSLFVLLLIGVCLVSTGTGLAHIERPYWVTAADVYNRGILDLIVVNHTTTEFVLMKGNGDGTFGRPLDVAVVGMGGWVAAVADFDGDDNLDVAVAVGPSNNVAVVFGNGEGGFQGRRTYAVGTEPRAIVAADIDGDGAPDLVTANWGSNTISVLLNNGDGTFAPAIHYNVQENPHFVSAGDLNGDGQTDLVVSNYREGAREGSISIFMSGGNNGLELLGHMPTRGINPNTSVITDLDGDGVPDIAVANAGSSNVSVFLSDGAGGFDVSTYASGGGGTLAVAAGDFNGDGYPDLALANSAANNVTILLNDGAGGFGDPTPYTVGMFPRSIAVGDFNQDDSLDLAVANTNSNSVTILLGDGTGGFAPPQ